MGILHIAGGKNAGHVGAAALVGDDIALCIQLDLSFEQLGHRGHANSDENTVQRQHTFAFIFGVSEFQSSNAFYKAFLLAQNLYGNAIPLDVNVFFLENLVLHSLRGAEGVAAVYQIHLRAEVGQVHGLFKGGVAAANDGHGTASEEVAVACGAGRHPETTVLLLALQS